MVDERDDTLGVGGMVKHGRGVVAQERDGAPGSRWFWRIAAVFFGANRFELANSEVEREGYKLELAGNGVERWRYKLELAGNEVERRRYKLELAGNEHFLRGCGGFLMGMKGFLGGGDGVFAGDEVFPERCGD